MGKQIRARKRRQLSPNHSSSWRSNHGDLRLILTNLPKTSLRKSRWMVLNGKLSTRKSQSLLACLRLSLDALSEMKEYQSTILLSKSKQWKTLSNLSTSPPSTSSEQPQKSLQHKTS